MRRPSVGAIAVVPRDGSVLLVRRGREPAKGLWGFPGGHVEWGETVAAAALRELREETGVIARARRSLGVIDAIGEGYHYVLCVTLCSWEAGEPVAGDDADRAEWVALDALPARPLVANVDEVLRRMGEASAVAPTRGLDAAAPQTRAPGP